MPQELLQCCKKTLSTCFACCIFCLHGTTRNGEGHPIYTFLWHPLDLRNKLSLPIVQIPKQHIPWPKQVTKATKRGDDAVSLMDLKAMKPTGFSSFAHSGCGYTATIPKVSNTQMDTNGSWFPSGKYFCQSISCAVGLIAITWQLQIVFHTFCPCAERYSQLNSKLLRPMRNTRQILVLTNVFESAWFSMTCTKTSNWWSSLESWSSNPCFAANGTEPKTSRLIDSMNVKMPNFANPLSSRPYNSLGFFRLQHLAKAQVGNTVSFGVSQQLSAEIHSTWLKLMKLMIQTCILEKEAKNCHSNHASFRGIGHIHVPQDFPGPSQATQPIDWPWEGPNIFWNEWQITINWVTKTFERHLFKGAFWLYTSCLPDLPDIPAVVSRWHQLTKRQMTGGDSENPGLSPMISGENLPHRPILVPPNSWHTKPTRDF